MNVLSKSRTIQESLESVFVNKWDHEIHRWLIVVVALVFWVAWVLNSLETFMLRIVTWNSLGYSDTNIGLLI